MRVKQNCYLDLEDLYTNHHQNNLNWADPDTFNPEALLANA